jgi:hypothetical protein
MSKLSRRSLVASAAALPALAVPAVAVAAELDRHHPDAELIKLAEAYERLVRVRAPLLADYNERWLAAINSLKGRDLTGPEYEAEMSRLWVESGSEKAHEKVEPLDDQLYDLALKIIDAPVHTVAGLRAKVVLVLDTEAPLWDGPPEDLDWDKRALRNLIEAVCSVGGFAARTLSSGINDEFLIYRDRCRRTGADL